MPVQDGTEVGSIAGHPLPPISHSSSRRLCLAEEECDDTNDNDNDNDSDSEDNDDADGSYAMSQEMNWTLSYFCRLIVE